MRTTRSALLGALVGIVTAIILEGLLLPHFQPFLTPVLPTVGGVIQTTVVGQNEALFNAAIRNTAAGYREPGDVLLTFISFSIVFGAVVGGVVAVARRPRPLASGWKTSVIGALAVLVALGLSYLLWAHTAELGARITAMHMYKRYQRNMAVLAPYISPQDARELGSQWARMGTRADLEAMDERLFALFQQHGLTSSGPPAAKPE